MIVDLPRPIRRWLWGPVAIMAAFIPLVVLHLMQIPTLLVWPFSRSLFRTLNSAIAGGVWSWWAFGMERVNGTRLLIRGDRLPLAENAVVICNHQQMGDIAVLAAVARRAGAVRHMKWLVKDALKYVPGIGWGLMFLDSVFLKREWARDEVAIRRLFSHIAENKLPVWLTSFPEGTRATAAKLRASRERSQAKGLAPYQHVLMPRTKGFVAGVVGLRGHAQAVYSLTIGYQGVDRAPSVVDLITGGVRHVAVDVRRFSFDTLPSDEAGLTAWLLSEFREKDRILSEMISQEGCRTAGLDMASESKPL